MPVDLPLYAQVPGEVVGSPPYLARDALVHGLLLKGSRSAQQRLCDTLLNETADGRLVFHAVTDWVLFNAVYVERMGSLDPIEKTRGTVPEIDLGFWTLVRGGIVGEESNWRLYWLPSFLFVDSGAAMAAGREIFGYFKSTSRIERRSDDPNDVAASVTCLHFRVFAPDARPVEDVLVEVSGATGQPGSGADADLSVDLSRMLGLEPNDAPPLPAFGMQQITLRQFRDPGGPSRASLRELLVLTLQPTKVRRVGILPSGATVRLSKSASYPIGEALGLTSENKAAFGFVVEQDFVVNWASRI
jgi:hypothetical protein